MRQVGDLSGVNSAAWLAIGVQVLTNPWIVLGIGFLVGSLLLYLAAISRLDLSYVLPMTAFKYVLSALFAGFILGEQVSQIRWMGTALVSSGVLLVVWAKRPQITSSSAARIGDRRVCCLRLSRLPSRDLVWDQSFCKANC